MADATRQRKCLAKLFYKPQESLNYLVRVKISTSLYLTRGGRHAQGDYYDGT